MLLTLRALETPRVTRRCPRCDVCRPFISSDNFRVNAQQHRLDVWLIYRCATCDATWNQTILTRQTHDAIGEELCERFLHNDRATAWRYAFDLDLLRSTGSPFELDVPYRIERSGEHDRSAIEIALPWPCHVRLDRLLANELGISRAELSRRVASREIELAPSAVLKKPARDGQRVSLKQDG